jgi:hypothetical protein
MYGTYIATLLGLAKVDRIVIPTPSGVLQCLTFFYSNVNTIYEAVWPAWFKPIYSQARDNMLKST